MRISSIALMATALVAGGMLSPMLHAQSATQSPSAVVEESAQIILKNLENNREAYRKDPAKREQLVTQYLLPHLDTERAAQLVLGQHWRTATPDQRKRFIDAFYHSMLANYGSALAELTASNLKVFPAPVEPGTKRTVVRTEVRRDTGDPIHINYAMELTDKGWQAYDMSIDGISYIKSFRDDFGAQIDAEGLDAVIARLQQDKPKSFQDRPKLQGKSQSSKEKS